MRLGRETNKGIPLPSPYLTTVSLLLKTLKDKIPKLEGQMISLFLKVLRVDKFRTPEASSIIPEGFTSFHCNRVRNDKNQIKK